MDTCLLFVLCSVMVLVSSSYEEEEAYRHTDEDIQADRLIKRPHCPKRCVCREKTAYCDSMLLDTLPRFKSSIYETVYLRDNYIRRLRNSRLRGLTQTKHLLLKGNQISHIESGAFRGMHKLMSLSLTDNQLRHLSTDAFAGLVMLQVFSLRDNALRNIEARFVSLHNLQLLNLGNNRIRSITDRTFKGNPLLRVLDLHNNSITNINKHAFRPLPFLKFLVLRDNPLGVIEFDFRGNFHLELLDLTNCQLTEMVTGLPHSINDLRLAENNITELLPKHFKTIRKIRLLVLNNNQISHIDPDAFKQLWQLYDLYIGANRINKIPANIPPGLRGFFANYNNISHLSAHMFPHHSRLENLYLKNNHINGVDKDALKDLKYLRSLDLSRNDLQNVAPYTFSNLSHLEILDLSNNPIEQLPRKSFHGLQNLHILQLNSVGGGARGAASPAIFEDISHLLFLDMSNSSSLAHQMAENPSMLNYLHSVVDLNLMEDQLSNLPPNFPLFFPNLKVVKLIGNPWHCDGNIWWMTEWLRNNSIRFYSPEYMQCATPTGLATKPLLDLTEEDLFTQEEIQNGIITQKPVKAAAVGRKNKPVQIAFTHGYNKQTNVTKFGRNFTVEVEVHTHSTNYDSKPTRRSVKDTDPPFQNPIQHRVMLTSTKTTTTSTTQMTTKDQRSTMLPTTTYWSTKPTTTTSADNQSPTQSSTTPPKTTTPTITLPKTTPPTTTSQTTTTSPASTTTTKIPTTQTTTKTPPITTPLTTTITPATTTTPAATTTETTALPPTGGSVDFMKNIFDNALKHRKKYIPRRHESHPSRFAPKLAKRPAHKVKGEYDDFYQAKERLNQMHTSLIFGQKKLKDLKSNKETSYVNYGAYNSNEEAASLPDFDYTTGGSDAGLRSRGRIRHHSNIAPDGQPAAASRSARKRKRKQNKQDDDYTHQNSGYDMTNDDDDNEFIIG